jgi:hypothetical protein
MIQRLPDVELDRMEAAAPNRRLLTTELLILDPAKAQGLIEERERLGLDRWDEV